MGKKPITLREHCARISRVKTPKKAAASRENGKLGGRPKMPRCICGQIMRHSHVCTS